MKTVAKLSENETSNSSSFQSSIFRAHSKKVPLSDSLNMDRSKKTLLANFPESLEQYKRLVLDLCQGCRSIAVSQELYDESTQVRRFRSSVNACMELSQSFATDLVDLSLNSFKPVSSRFCLTHVCPAKTTFETVPVIDNEFISSPCCFTALYKLTCWKKKLIPALDLEVTNKSTSKYCANKVTDLLSDFNCARESDKLSKTVIGSHSKDMQPYNLNSRKEKKILVLKAHQNFENMKRKDPPKAVDVISLRKSPKKGQSRVRNDAWPWEINDNLRLRIFEEQQKLKQQVLNNIDARFEGLTSYSLTPSPSRRKQRNVLEDSRWSQSESKTSETRKLIEKEGYLKSKMSGIYDRSITEAKVLNYSLDDSFLSIDEIKRKRNRQSKGDFKVTDDDKWPWEDEKSVKKFVNDSLRKVKANESFDGATSDWNISPIARKASNDDRVESGNHVDLNEVPLRPISSRATVRSMPCRAPEVFQHVPVEHEEPKKPKKAQRCLNLRAVNRENDISMLSSDRTTTDESRSDIERRSDHSNRSSKSYSRKNSQHCVEPVSRQQSDSFHEVIEEILTESNRDTRVMFGDDMNSSSQRNSLVYCIEAEVHQEPRNCFKDLLFSQKLNTNIESSEELRDEFYDLPDIFHHSGSMSFDSLSSMSNKQEKLSHVAPKKSSSVLESTEEERNGYHDQTDGCLKARQGDKSMDQSFVSVSSIADTDCFNSAAIKNGLRKAAKSIFKKSDSGNESSSSFAKREQLPMSRYMSFANQRDGYHSDPECLFIPKEFKLGLTSMKNEELDCKVTQTEFDNTSSGVQCDCSADILSQDTCVHEICTKETQTEFSSHNTSKVFSEEEGTSNLNGTLSSESVTSGCYKVTQNVEKTSKHFSSVIGRPSSYTLTEMYLNENTEPFSDISRGLEDCFSYADEYFKSRNGRKWYETEDGIQNAQDEKLFANEAFIKDDTILPDISTRINNVESAFLQAASRFSSLDDVLDSCQKTISQMPGGSLSSDLSLSVNNSRLSMVRNEDFESNQSLKRTNFRLSPLSSPLRKKDKAKDSKENLRDALTPVDSSSKRSSPLLSGSARNRRDNDELVSRQNMGTLKDSVIKELKFMHSKSDSSCSEEEKNSLSEESDVSLLAPLAASESLMTVNSARLSRSFDRDSFLDENRRSSSAKLSFQTEVNSLNRDATAFSDEIENENSVSMLNRQISMSRDLSEIEATKDYDEQYKEISDSYQNLDQKCNEASRRYSFEQSSVLNSAMICDDDSLNAYRFDPIAEVGIPMSINDSIISNESIAHRKGDLSQSYKVPLNDGEVESKSNEFDNARFFSFVDVESSGFESSVTFGSITSSIDNRSKKVVDFDYTVGLKACSNRSDSSESQSFRDCELTVNDDESTRSVINLKNGSEKFTLSSKKPPICCEESVDGLSDGESAVSKRDSDNFSGEIVQETSSKELDLETSSEKSRSANCVLQ